MLYFSSIFLNKYNTVVPILPLRTLCIMTYFTSDLLPKTSIVLIVCVGLPLATHRLNFANVSRQDGRTLCSAKKAQKPNHEKRNRFGVFADPPFTAPRPILADLAAFREIDNYRWKCSGKRTYRIKCMVVGLSRLTIESLANQQRWCARLAANLSLWRHTH